MGTVAFEKRAFWAFSFGPMILAVALSGGFCVVFAGQVRAAETAAGVDTDNDGLANVMEIDIYKTDPNNADTDGDSFNDGEEVQHGYSPREAGKRMMEVDSDKDYLNDAWETAIGSDLLNADTDGDLYLDGTEVAASYDPLVADPVKREKLISVSLAKQELSYSFGGTVLDSFLISSGLKNMKTPTGTFHILDKVPVKNYGGPGFGFYLPNTKWNLHFTTGRWRYYIHGAYWHNNFGHVMSHGCVNVAYKNMEALYNWAEVGTKVVISKI